MFCVSVGVAILAALISPSHCSLPPEFMAVVVVVVVAAAAMLAMVACEFFAANVGIFLREFVGRSSLLLLLMLLYLFVVIVL